MIGESIPCIIFPRSYYVKRFYQQQFSIFNSDHPVQGTISHLIEDLVEKNKGFVLDIGAGDCPHRNSFKSWTYRAVDVIQNAKGTIDEIINRENPRINLADSSVDMILCTHVLEHAIFEKPLLDEIFRVLKPGGNLIVVVPFMYREHMMPFDYRRYSVVGICTLLQTFEYTVRECYTLGNAWFTAYRLILERHVDDRKSSLQSRLSLLKLTERFIHYFIFPLLALTLFRTRTSSTYSAVFLRAQKKKSSC